MLAIWAHHRGFASDAHRQFVTQAEDVAAGGADLAGANDAYPPLPVLLAGIVPGGTLGLSLVACLAGGITLQRTLEGLVRKGQPVWLIVCVLLPLVAVPGSAYTATQSLGSIASLALLATALEGMRDFSLGRSTEAGFRTGLALAAAFLFDPLAVFFATAIGISAVFVSRSRHNRQPGAATATVAVTTFPVAFVVLAAMFVQWRLTGDAVPTVATNPDIMAFRHGLLGGLLTALAAVGVAVLHAPLYLAVGTRYLRRPLALASYLVAVPISVLASWEGVRLTPMTAYLLLTLIALTNIPRALSRRRRVVLAVAAIGQLVLMWALPTTTPDVQQWLQAIL